MTFNSLFFQIILAGLALALIFLFIKPAMADIGELQGAIIEYQKGIDNIEKVNKQIDDYSKKITDMKTDDKNSLLKYMPNKVDDVGVARDIFNIAKSSNLEVDDIRFDPKGTKVDLFTPPSMAKHRTMPVPYKFTIKVRGSYNDIAGFMQNIEDSDYPLEVFGLKLVKEGDTTNTATTNMLGADVEIITYSHS